MCINEDVTSKYRYSTSDKEHQAGGIIGQKLAQILKQRAWLKRQYGSPITSHAHYRLVGVMVTTINIFL